MFRALLPAGKLLRRNPQSFSLFGRCQPIYSDTFHGIEQFTGHIAKQKLLVDDVETFKQRVRENFRNSGMQNIFTEEIRKFQLFAKDEQEMELAMEMMIEIFNSQLSFKDVQSIQSIFRAFFTICYINKWSKQAIAAWNHPQLKKSLMLTNVKKLSRVYFDLLFVCGNYTEIVQEFQREPEFYSKMAGQPALTITSFACYKLNTTDSLQQLMAWLPLVRRENVGNSSVFKAAALLAFNQQELGLAYDIVKVPSTSIDNYSGHAGCLSVGYAYAVCSLWFLVVI